MRTKALVLIEGSRSNGLLYVQAARRRGLQPITLAADPTQYDYLMAEGGKAIMVDTDDFDAVKRECLNLATTCDIAGFVGFATRGESVNVTVGKLCRRFDRPGPDPLLIERCCDKFNQRQLLTQNGLPVPTFRWAASAMTVDRAAANIGFPVIVKPAVGNGSSGVRLCRDAAELAEHTTYLLGGAFPWRSSPTILVEEFVEGPFYDVVTMGSAVIAIGSAEFGPPPHFVPRRSMFPAQLTDEEHEGITDVSLRCLQALGLGWGPANVELRWTKRGPVVMEVNPRLPGWTTSRLVQLAYGLDVIEQHISLVIGEECDLHKSRSRVAAAHFFVPDRDGTLAHIRGTDLAEIVPGIAEVRFYVDPGVSLVRKGDYLDIIGHVIAASTDPAEAEAILHRALNLVDWAVAPSPGEQANGRLLGT
ncbi:ATP-grasp domain-containing protein [Rhizobium laguerreae]|uniref:ATP-grasp domain-containing protein n=1 Tax=Rhizobium laguerreae TaxID=1076926 RepID=UPI001C9116EB|nr:ATP-grasp domain-containing protein [Rhizobium laguerreae]MBY3496386.1 ATP-grasp domain-containing protein [Rhizobium laguerreae]MBY3544283.1 ATP-grasp domain-containing protein [Rhizobium laguerreae]